MDNLHVHFGKLADVSTSLQCSSHPQGNKAVGISR